MDSSPAADQTTALLILARLWPTLTDGQMRILSENMVVRNYEKHETIYLEGEEPSQMFLLLDGKVKIYKEGVGGRTQIVRMAKPHGFFGYRAGFANETYSTSAAAFEPSTLCVIATSAVKAVMRGNFEVGVYFLNQLARLLRHADEQTVNLTQKHIRGRLAEGLLRLQEHYGKDSATGVLNIQLSREDLASLSNMTTSNAIRTLSAFAAERLIAIDGRKIKIIQEEELRKISSMG